MIGPDHEQQARMATDLDRSLEQIERETSAFMGRLGQRWAIRWAVVFAVIFGLTRMVDWLDWLWWIAVPMALLSLAVPLLFRHFLMKRLAKMRGTMGAMGAAGQTIDGSWQDTTGDAPTGTSSAEPGGIIIDQREPDDDARL